MTNSQVSNIFTLLGVKLVKFRDGGYKLRFPGPEGITMGSPVEKLDWKTVEFMAIWLVKCEIMKQLNAFHAEVFADSAYSITAYIGTIRRFVDEMENRFLGNH